MPKINIARFHPTFAEYWAAALDADDRRLALSHFSLLHFLVEVGPQAYGLTLTAGERQLGEMLLERLVEEPPMPASGCPSPLLLSSVRQFCGEVFQRLFEGVVLPKDNRYIRHISQA